MREPFSINRLNELVEYITTPPYHNITQSADFFNTSRATINKALKELSDPSSLYYDEWKDKRVKTVLSELLKIARSRAGSKSKKKVLIDHELALSLRYLNVYVGATLRDIGKMVGCSHMTVCNAINALSEEDLFKQDQLVAAEDVELRYSQIAAVEEWLLNNGVLSSEEISKMEEQWLAR